MYVAILQIKQIIPSVRQKNHSFAIKNRCCSSDANSPTLVLKAVPLKWGGISGKNNYYSVLGGQDYSVRWRGGGGGVE